MRVIPGLRGNNLDARGDCVRRRHRGAGGRRVARGVGGRERHVVAPGGKIPGALLETDPLQLSVAVGAPSETAAPAGLLCSATTGPGTFESIGPVTSRTVRVTVSVAVPPFRRSR